LETSIQISVSKLRYFRIVKPLIVLISSFLLIGFALWLPNRPTSLAIFVWFFAGFLQTLLFFWLSSIVFYSLVKSKLQVWLRVAFGPKPTLSIAFLTMTVFSVGVLLTLGSLYSWDNIQYLSAVLALIGGTAAGIALAERLFSSTKVNINYRIKSNRYEFFAATLLSCIFSATHFHIMKPEKPWQDVGMALIPLVFAFVSLLATWVCAYWLERSSQQNDTLKRITVNVVTSMLLLMLSDMITDLLIPAYIIYNGREYSSEVVFGIMQTGILVGFSAGLITFFYPIITQWYINYLLHTQSRWYVLHFVLRLFINGVIGFLPFGLVVCGILKGYASLNIYGVSLMLISMLSNVGLNRLLIESDKLRLENLQRLTASQRAKIAIISPTLRQVVQHWLQKGV